MRNKVKQKINKKFLGYTVIEIILVITVIGIIVTVSIASYGGWRQSVVVGQLKSDLTNVASAMENARNFGTGYPVSIPSSFSATSGNILSGGGSSDGKTFCISVSNSQFPSLVYYVNSSNREPQSGPCPYTLTVSVSGVGGTVTGGGVFPAGSVKTVTATPSIGYGFSGWSNCSTETTTIINVTMNSDKTCVASFATLPLIVPGLPGYSAPALLSGAPPAATTIRYNWLSVDCKGNIPRYRYRFYHYTDPPMDPYNPNVYVTSYAYTTGNSVTYTFQGLPSRRPIYLTIELAAECYNDSGSSGYGPTHAVAMTFM